MASDITENSTIFDQHFTDSLLRKVLKPNEYKRVNPEFNLARSLPKKQVLLPLLLFNKAYLVKPYWLQDFDSRQLERLRREDLIDWIPEDQVRQAQMTVIRMLSKKQMISLLPEPEIHIPSHKEEPQDPLDFSQGIEYDDLKTDFVRNINFSNLKEVLDHEIEYSDLQKDIEGLAKELSYLDPLLRGHLAHLKQNTSILEKLTELSEFEMVNNADASFSILDTDPFLSMKEEKDFIIKCRGSFQLELMNKKQEFSNEFFKTEKEINEYYFSSFETRDEPAISFRDIWNDALSRRALLDSCLITRMIDLLASKSHMPVMSGYRNSDKRFLRNIQDSPQKNKFLLETNKEAYQLIRLQFQKMRYPVIENIEDVLRLRESKHLSAYRKVINEYSSRMRVELGKEQTKVLEEFKRDLDLALKDLKWLNTNSKFFDDMVFYISIPLAIIGAFLQIPLSDILSISVGGPWKTVKWGKRQDLDWFLFGRT